MFGSGMEEYPWCGGGMLVGRVAASGCRAGVQGGELLLFDANGLSNAPGARRDISNAMAIASS